MALNVTYPRSAGRNPPNIPHKCNGARNTDIWRDVTNYRLPLSITLASTHQVLEEEMHKVSRRRLSGDDDAECQKAPNHICLKFNPINIWFMVFLWFPWYDNPIWCPKASWHKKKIKIKGMFKALSYHFFLFLTFSC